MEQTKVVTDMIAFQKTAFTNSFQAMALVQDQIGQVAHTTVKQAHWLPAESRRAVDQWLDACKGGRESYKRYVDDGYQRLEAYFADSFGAGSDS